MTELAASYERLRTDYPNDFFLPFQWGAILCDRQQWSEAAEVMLPALALVPLHFEARKLPVLALCRTGRPDQAAEVLLGPDSPHGFFVADYATEIMSLLERQGRRDQAAALGRSLLEKAPRLPWRGRIEAVLSRMDTRP